MTTDSNNLSEAPFQIIIINALLDEETPLNPRFLFHLSDLEGEDLQSLKDAWPRIPVEQRRALLENLEDLAEDDYLLSFESICRLAIDDDDPQVRVLAIRPMFTYEPEDLIPQISQMLETDPDENVRAVCASTLGKFVYLGEIEELPEHIKDGIVERLLRVAHSQDNREVRRRALEALGFASSEEVPKLIADALETDETDWLVSALFAMGRTFDKRWIPQVTSMLDHQLPGVRFEAVRAAGELEISAAAPQLIELLEDSDDDVRFAAAWSLSQIGGEDAREALENLLEATHNDEEADLIQDALDNLLFNEEMRLFDLMDLTDDDEEYFD